MVGVSLTMAFFIVLRKNLSFWSALQFWRLDFFSQEQPENAEILCVFQRRWVLLWGKRFLQNRVNPYVRPPKAHALSHNFLMKKKQKKQTAYKMRWEIQKAVYVLTVLCHFKFSFAVLQDAISITRSDVHLEESVLKVWTSIYFVLCNNSSQ